MILIYNGIQLQVGKLHAFVTQGVKTGDGADYVATRYLLDVSAVYSPAFTSYAANRVPTAGRLPAQTSAAITHYLNEPRGALSYADEAGNVVVASPPPGNTTDAINGPTPLHVHVREIIGQKVWMVHFAVETFLVDCPGGGAASPLMANRFSQTQQVDEQQLTTIITQGESWFRLDGLEDVGRTADSFRNLVVPAVTQGFRRVSLNAQVSFLGNKLTWQSVDRELVPCQRIGDLKNPDVLSFDGRYTQQSLTAKDSVLPSGIVGHSVQMQVVGRPQAARANLVVFGVKAALAKLPLKAGALNPAVDILLTRIAVSEHLGGNGVDISIEAQGPAAQAGAQGMGGLQTGFFFNAGIAYQFQAPFLDDNGLAPSLGSDNNTRTPTALALAFAAALQAPCTTPSPIKGAPGPGTGSAFYNIGPAYNIGVSIGDTTGGLSQSVTRWSQDNSSAPFTDYRIDNRIDVDQHKLQAPITGPVSGSSQYGHSDPKTGGWVPDQPNTKTSEVMMLGLPTATMVSEWTAERLGKEPMAPNPRPADPNFALMEWSVQPASPALLADGDSNVFRLSGRYVYAMLVPPQPGDPVPFPVSPNIQNTFGDYGVTDFRDGLIMANNSQSTSPATPVLNGVGGNF